MIKNLKSQISEFEKKLKTSKGADKKINTMILDNLKAELLKENEREENRKNKNTNKALNEALARINLKIIENESTNDLMRDKELKKEKRRIQSKLRDNLKELRYLTQLEYRVLNKELKNTNLKYYLMVNLSFEGALRGSELATLRVEDYNPIDGTLICRRKKGSKTNRIPLSNEIKTALQTYINDFKPYKYLFLSNSGTPFTTQGLNYFFKKYCKKIGIEKEKSHWHILKHTRGVYLAEKGLTLQEIQQMLGHTSIASTLVYASFTTNQEVTMYNKLGLS